LGKTAKKMKAGGFWILLESYDHERKDEVEGGSRVSGLKKTATAEDLGQNAVRVVSLVLAPHSWL